MLIPNFKPVYIFGAGASKMLGLPLTKDFLRTANQLRQSYEFPFNLIDIFDDVFRYKDELYKSQKFLKTNLENIETLFSILDMEVQLSSGERRCELEAIRQKLFTLIIKTLELSLDHTQWENYKRLVLFLAKPESAAFLTFNYDLCIENALASNGKASYSIEYEKDKIFSPIIASGSSRKVYKIHGSANWIWCSECEELTDDSLNYCTLPYSRAHHDTSCENHHELNLIIPPTWNKLNYADRITHTWMNSLQEISKATHLFFIGYSFPRTDVFFDQLFFLGLLNNKNLQKIVIVNSDPEIETKIINPYFSDNFKTDILFIPKRFEDLFSETNRDRNAFENEFEAQVYTTSPIE
jgi:NAD-dependent SIR2 family protein deacetylase